MRSTLDLRVLPANRRATSAKRPSLDDYDGNYEAADEEDLLACGEYWGAR